MPWTTDQVLALAPDPGSAKSGKDLGAARKWVTLGASDACAWGTLQGSGRDPYQTCIDLGGPAFKCTCPSRKFPCKHGLGLFLILAQQPAALTEKSPPAWAAEWLAKRVEKEEQKAAKATAPAVPPDPEAAAKQEAAAAKRAESREARVSAGLDELGVWLSDLVRGGFASLPGKPAQFWETPAARLVDGQAPGLARRLRALDGITTTGEDWPARLLREAALLHLVREGWARVAHLPAEIATDVRTTLGFPLSQEQVLAQAGVRDRWLILGQRVIEEERLRTQRTWLWGVDSGRPALSLSFSAAASQPLDVSLASGTVLDAELAFFPGAWPLRAVVKQRFGAPLATRPPLPHATIAAAHEFAATAFMTQPWLEQVPFALEAVVPVHQPHGGWIVRDADAHCLPLQLGDAKAWSLVALSGGHPLSLAGEWNGETLRPVGVWAEGRFLPL